NLFTNVTTDPTAVARLAARYVIADSDGAAGAVIVTDPAYRIATFKADIMASELRTCARCRLLSLVRSPISEAQQRMPAVVSGLLKRFGRRFGYLLAINGAYVGGARAGLEDAGRHGTDAPYGVAAGDGDAAELERIRGGDYQLASVAEPLYLQGWQLIDELNRALAGERPSGYVAPPRLITRANAPEGGVFDPPSGYRETYRRIWSG
ncbi:MAG TPA: substrate-binding domain-containing protein, partial [Baekduia sp.]|nr:substrate-binding domain-containing protein [Baekduia sp.]